MSRMIHGLTTWLRQRTNPIRQLHRNTVGGMLVESLVGITVITTIASVSFLAVSTATRASARAEQSAIAENVARNQMEWVFSQPYAAPATGYTATSTPSGYSAFVTTSLLPDFAADTSIEKITITVNFGAEEIISIETIRSEYADEDDA